MKIIKNKIIACLALFLSFSHHANAQLNSRNDVQLTDPVGGDLLPGAKILEADNIRSSFVFTDLLPFLITYAIRLAIALSVLAVMIGGYQYMTAYGDEEKYKVAQKTITFAVVGLIISITAFGIVRVITNLNIVS